jgi:hypothetical protein
MNYYLYIQSNDVKACNADGEADVQRGGASQ